MTSPKTPNEEQLDCIALKDRVQSEIYEEIKDLSHDEEIAYFRRRVEKGPFADLWRRIRSTARAEVP